MLSEPKIVVHNKFTKEFKALFSSMGYYDSETETVHILSPNLMFKWVLEHERVHHDRRNNLKNRFLDLFIKTKFRRVVTFIILSTMLINFGILFNQKYIFLTVILFITLLFGVWTYEEIIAERKTIKVLPQDE